MKMKDMKRTDWARVLRKEETARDFLHDGKQARVSLTILRELTAPLTIPYASGDILIADRDYSWLQAAVKDGFVWLTAMYDSHGGLVELYFDITGGNRFDDPENPCFRDMYLDIMVAGDVMEVLDRDELDEALEQGDITRQEYDHAQTVCRELYTYLQANREAVIAWCGERRQELLAQMP